MKCPYLLQVLHWNFLAGHLKPSTCLESPHLEHLSFLVWACLGSYFLLLEWNLLVFTWILLVTGWSWLERLFLLVLPWWEVCLLMSHQIDLGHFGVTCNLFDVKCCGLWNLHFLCKLPDFACRKLFYTYTAIMYGFGYKLFILQEEPQYVMMQDVYSFFWVLGKLLVLVLHCTTLYRSVPLSEACKQVKSGSYFICLWLAKIFILGPYCIQAEVICRKAQGNILIHHKITTPSYDFLAFLWLR